MVLIDYVGVVLLVVWALASIRATDVPLETVGLPVICRERHLVRR